MRRLYIILIIFSAAIIVFVFFPISSSTDKNWNDDQTRSRANELLYALAAYKTDHQQIPDGSYETIVGTLLHSDNGVTYLDHFDMNDSWKRPFHIDFTTPSKSEVRSAGKDGILHSVDDIFVTLNTTEQDAAANP